MGSLADPSGASDPFYVFYHYHSVPIQRTDFGFLLNNIIANVGRPFTKLFFFCDVRGAPMEFVDDVEGMPNSEVVHIFWRSKEQFEEVLQEKMKAICEGLKGTAVLYYNGDGFDSTLKDLTEAGWTAHVFRLPVQEDCVPPQRNMPMPSVSMQPSMMSPRPPMQSSSQFLPKYTPRKNINRKCTPQCPQWEDKVHSEDVFCPFFHPEKACMFYPMCRTGAESCMFAHPFCRNGGCQCDGSDPQLNHFMAD